MCEDSVSGRHSPADAYGRCAWCGAKFTSAASFPYAAEVSNLTEAYGTHFDPDYPDLGDEEIRRRYSLGQDG